MVDFTCKFFFRVFKRCLFQVWAFKILISVLNPQIMVFHFVHFEHKKVSWYILVNLLYIGFFFCLAGLIKAILVRRPCNWTLIIVLLWFVMVLLWQADLSKRKLEFHNCLRRTLRKDSIDSFN